MSTKVSFNGRPSAPDFFSEAKYESFDAAVRSANEFVSGCSVKVLNVATVVLPNVWKGFEGGATDPSISIQRETTSTWHQFIRVWLRQLDGSDRRTALQSFRPNLILDALISHDTREY